MNAERIAQLQAFFEKEPNDPFLIYALATEYATERPQLALLQFERLLADFPEYTATYYHAAALYESLGDDRKAEETYRKGLDLLQESGDMKSLSELQMAYDEFLEDREDEEG